MCFNEFPFQLGMAIFARPADTRSGPILMGRVLPDPIRNGVGYGFFLKTRNGSGSGLDFIKKNPRPDPKPDPDKNPVLKNYKNTPPIYIPLSSNPKSNLSFLSFLQHRLNQISHFFNLSFLQHRLNPRLPPSVSPSLQQCEIGQPSHRRSNSSRRPKLCQCHRS